MSVFIIAAMSADGFIGLDSAHRSLDWRSKADAKFFIEKTKQAGVIIMGATTYRTFRIKRAPPGRRLIVMSRTPENIEGENVEATSEQPAELIARLKHEGFESIAVSGGSSIYEQFLEAGLIDEIYLTTEPVMFGQGVNLFKNPIDVRLELAEVKNLSKDTLLLKYRILK